MSEIMTTFARVKQFVTLLRPHQWLKNAFVFLPVFFDGSILRPDGVLPSVAVLVAFCLAASGIYCLNDVVDAASDRLHPVKRLRPIASGAVSPAAGCLLTLGCQSCSLLWLVCVASAVLSDRLPTVVFILCAYVAMNVAYCFWLKRIAIIDVFVIATGFVLRVLAGGEATGVEPSSWLVLMTFLLALFLAFCKRRDDVVMYESTGVLSRGNVSHYNLTFMNQIISIIASVLMVCYVMYTMSPEVTGRFGSGKVYMTTVFVLAGIIRYLQLTIVDDRSGSPTKVLLTDRFIHLCVVGWMLAFATIIYVL